MARQNRSEIFDPLQVSVNHCINRAVRRAMLCGVDRYSGQSYALNTGAVEHWGNEHWGHRQRTLGPPI